jgi:hypothetical protein
LCSAPQGPVVLGDGICSFNPIYGQGMTVAAIEALIMRDHMKRHRPMGARRLRARLAGATRTPWNMTVAGDLAFPGVQGRRTPAIRAANSYLGRVLAAAEEDATVGAAFVRVSGLVNPPITLLRPRVAVRALSAHT